MVIRRNTWACHSRYRDNSNRPLCRGWLHGAALLCSLHYISTREIKTPVLPAAAAMLWTLFWSSLVHLVPWESPGVEELVTRLDRTGIVAICGCSFVIPQLVVREECTPPLIFSVLTVIGPCLLGMLRIMWGDGNKPETLIVSCGIAAVSTITFLATVDIAAALWAVATVSCYAVGMALYVFKPGDGLSISRVWGYHEWMHVAVIVGFVVNIQALEYIANLCAE